MPERHLVIEADAWYGNQTMQRFIKQTKADFQIDVIGYPSNKNNLEKVFGLEAVKESLLNQKGSKKKPPRSSRKKSHPFRPRRR